MTQAIESVWDYPRPPRLEPTTRHLQVIFADQIIAETQRGYRVLETTHPPAYYFPPDDVWMEWLVPNPWRTWCEFKGSAAYFDLVVGEQRAELIAWSYPNPTPPFAAIRDYLSFYAGRGAACFVDGKQVQPQPGNFYGGWITSELRGPFKGGLGTRGW